MQNSIKRVTNPILIFYFVKPHLYLPWNTTKQAEETLMKEDNKYSELQW